MDYVGISVMIITSFFPQIYNIFECDTHWQSIYLGGITIMGISTIITLLLPVLSTGKFRSFRAFLFVAMGLFGLIPAIHAVIVNWSEPQRNRTLAYEAVMALSYLIGTMQEGIDPESSLLERSIMLMFLRSHSWKGMGPSKLFPPKRRTLKFENEFIQPGIFPDNLLSLTSNVTREEAKSDDRKLGKGPLNSFPCKCKNRRDDRFTHEGTPPLKLFQERSKKLSSLLLQKPDGIGPSKAFFDKARETNGKSPIQSGILPENKLSLKSNSHSSEQFIIPSGISPEKTLLSKNRALSFVRSKVFANLPRRGNKPFNPLFLKDKAFKEGWRDEEKVTDLPRHHPPSSNFVVLGKEGTKRRRGTSGCRNSAQLLLFSTKYSFSLDIVDNIGNHAVLQLLLGDYRRQPRQLFPNCREDRRRMRPEPVFPSDSREGRIFLVHIFALSLFGAPRALSRALSRDCDHVPLYSLGAVLI
ncbi:hypothetical protein RJ640_003570 [Escallonia rubra]|uniref:Uncharacterized protein n=1 Tax=Escallonia rubra TaxID=112253 RepID=A0AA88U9G9_9ASTE|nr:hypothetical protein RJ640_003570 [Escallonia rubra]